jgi:hypothetical protein
VVGSVEEPVFDDTTGATTVEPFAVIETAGGFEFALIAAALIAF